MYGGQNADRVWSGPSVCRRGRDDNHDDNAPPPPPHTVHISHKRRQQRPSPHLRVDREAAVELFPRLGRQPLRKLLLEHDHGAAEHGPMLVGGGLCGVVGTWIEFWIDVCVHKKRATPTAWRAHHDVAPAIYVPVRKKLEEQGGGNLIGDIGHAHVEEGQLHLCLCSGVPGLRCPFGFQKLRA